MSNRILNLVWDHSPSKGTELLVLLSLADQANDEGVCWPAFNSIAQRARISRRQAIRCIADLVESGQVVKVSRTRDDNSHTSNRYHIFVGQVGVSSVSLPSDTYDTRGVTKLRHHPSDADDTRGVTKLRHHPSDTTVSLLEPSFNHQLNREMNPEGEPLSQTPLSELVKSKSKAPKGGEK